MRGKRDSLIERYLEGRMTVPEERRFRHRLEQDEELLEMLRTELLIRSTMAGERGRAHAGHSRTRARAMAMLAAAPRAMEQAAATAAATASGGEAGGMLSGLAGFKGIVTMVAVAAAAAGSYIALVPSGTAGPSPATAPAYGGAGTPAQTGFPVRPEPAPALHPEADRTGSEQSQTSGTAGPSARGTAPEPERSRPAGEAASVPHAATQEAGGSNPEETTLPATPEQPAAVREAEEPPVTIRNDTLRTRLKIESMQRP